MTDGNTEMAGPAGPWTSFDEVVNRLVRPPLTDVQDRVDDGFTALGSRMTELTGALEDHDTDTRDRADALDAELRALQSAVQDVARAVAESAQAQADGHQTLRRIGDDTARRVDELAERSASDAGALGSRLDELAGRGDVTAHLVAGLDQRWAEDLRTLGARLDRLDADLAGRIDPVRAALIDLGHDATARRQQHREHETMVDTRLADVDTRLADVTARLADVTARLRRQSQALVATAVLWFAVVAVMVLGLVLR